MIDLLASVPGPAFLVFYACLTLVCVVAGRWMIGRDSSTGFTMPDFAHFDSITLATLTGGWSHAVRTALFDLWNRGLVTIDGSGTEATVRQAQISAAEASRGLKSVKPLTAAVYRHVTGTMTAGDIFAAPGLKEAAEQYLSLVYRDLDRYHLIKNDDDRRRAWTVFGIFLAIMYGVGFSKLIMGMSRGRPVLFLMIFLAASCVLLLLGLRPWEQASSLGRRYLSALNDHFAWTKERLKSRSLAAGIDPTFVVALFGAAVLAATPYDRFQSAFHKSTGSGCGGCSGGGCSGGGGCGGGCGGCGGCGG